jgi:hypothetical protein
MLWIFIGDESVSDRSCDDIRVPANLTVLNRKLAKALRKLRCCHLLLAPSGDYEL